MKHKILYLFLLLLYSCFLQAQNLDSLAILNQFESYEFSGDSSVHYYHKLWLKHKYDLTPLQTVKYGKKGAEAAKKNKQDYLYVSISLKYIGILNNLLLKVEEARSLLSEIAPTVEVLNDNYFLGKYYSILGVADAIEGKLSSAAENYFKAYNFYKNSDKPESAAPVLMHLSYHYFNLQDTKNAIKYAKEVLLLNKYQKEEVAIQKTIKVYNLISAAFSYNQNNIDSAFYYINKALIIANQVDTIKNYDIFLACCDTYLEGLSLYLNEGNLLKADSLKVKSTPCKGRAEPTYSLYTAKYYLAKEDYPATAEMLKNMPINKEYLGYEYERLQLKGLYLEGVGNIAEALKVYKESNEIYEELVTENRIQATEFANIRFETAKKEEEIKKLALKTETETLKSQQLLIGLIGSALLFFISLFFYNKLKQNKKIIEQQSAELKRVDILKSKLFANISHELRTPLTLISGAIEQIPQQVKLNKTAQKQLTLAKNSSEHLLYLSNQIMDLTKSEVDKIKANIACFKWNDLIDSILPFMEAKVKNNGLTLHQPKDDDTQNIELQSDPIKLKVIIDNLLQNAIKYNKEGGTIHLAVKDKGDNLEIWVKDTGIGIEQTELPLVLNRYYQSKNNRESIDGFGIGLAVCQEYVYLLGGTIKLESKLNVGTTIVVNIPKKIETTEVVTDYTFESVTFSMMPSLNTDAPKSNYIDTAHLLIVEDNEDVCQFLQTILNEEYALSFASNGIEALKKLEEITPSLILTDWMMPKMNGLTFLEKLKEQPHLSKIPTIMLTARSLSLDQLKAFQKGVDDYLLKPFETEHLKLRIEHLLDSADTRATTKLPDETKFTSLERQILAKDDAADFGFSNKKDVEWIKNLEKAIQDQLGDFDLSTEKIASKMELSIGHLNQKIKVITGLTSMKFINEIRFWEARRLLEEKEELSVKGVSYRVGFKSVKNFSRNFKKRFGNSPSTYLN